MFWLIFKNLCLFWACVPRLFVWLLCLELTTTGDMAYRFWGVTSFGNALHYTEMTLPA